ncbi:serine/threonine-protein kinase EDR1 isoform X1 [Cinnamomum micranthum f. kanehirae]|uniref:non-specific serine/threonine protein kinase n=1 Tax=Cinnamomum micranthum f. kanehirae TaxID=337451 RepID=A0A443PDW7_9MAGN|nr:serine/threonine-protein kinase EDR1 isoform X1 [Cinnamomum micranthum f. kanehirae]
MKHIFKKLHFGNSSSSSSHAHDPSRSSNDPSAPTPSCASDHRTTSAQTSGHSPVSPSSPSPAASTTPSAVASAPDYFTSEEEFQVQLALAISASNSEFRDGNDPDNDQIRAATLLSLGRLRIDSVGEGEEAAVLLSRQYWEYNVLDYNEKVVDGFYDIYGLSTDPASQGKMPSLVDLQTNAGNLGFEVVMVNRAIDPALEELEQIAQCIAVDCPVAEVGLLVQRIADLVTEHMGGPVRDASDILARWVEKSAEIRSSLQTNIFPIGVLNVGLSRHRALLFKLLADKVGIPCRLVKGSHYTGIDDDAVNIIKGENESECLVDLMAAPGTLLPADILTIKDAPLNSCKPRLTKNPTPWTVNDLCAGLAKLGPSPTEYMGGHGKSVVGNNRILDRKPSPEKALLIPSFPSSSHGPTNFSIGNSSNGNSKKPVLANQSNQFPTSTSATQQNWNREAPSAGDCVNEKLNTEPYMQDAVDSRDLFADLNPFQMIGAGRASAQNKAADNKINEFQRHRENVSLGPGRPPLPSMRKNRSACNEVPKTKQSEFVEGLFPRKNFEAKEFRPTSLSPSSSATSEKFYLEGPNVNVAKASAISQSTGAYDADNGVKGASSVAFGCHPSGGAGLPLALNANQHMFVSDDGRIPVKKSLTSTQSAETSCHEEDRKEGWVLLNREDELKDQHKRVNNKHDKKKCIHDRFMETTLKSEDHETSNSPGQAGLSRLDPMLDDVAEWEIPWEDLVIGERIGLGSYGEVYHADWNGTEVAVKKFLDQDFSGDALDEFRSEVRIMRRLRHPNVVLFMGAVTRPPNLSIVTEFLPRGSLYRILHRPNCQIDEKRRIKMALDVAKGMNCLHTSIPTIVHRDLKSPNLLVDNNWNVKVCDFGLSRLKHNTFLSSKSTAGTPEWMAPEVLRNEPSNEKCDVYSFGVILWELATLRMPWSGMNPMQVVGAVGFQNRRLDVPKEVDPLVANIILKCWQSDPSLRPSFAQLTYALKPLQRLVVSSHSDAHNSHLPQEISDG